MSRKHLAVFLLQVALTCSACGERDTEKAGYSRAFQRKRICAEFGRQRLALDRRKSETESEGVAHVVEAEWCFSTDLNTCIYSSTNEVMVTFDDSIPRIVAVDTRTIDLLTNRTLISVERNKAKRAEIENYDRKKRELFSKCQ